MKNDFSSYLDGFDEIALIIPKSIYNKKETYVLSGNKERISLHIAGEFDIGEEMKLIANFDAYVALENTYYVESSLGHKSFLKMGKIHRDDLFDSIYHYKKSDLGFTYTKESTKFKLWAPTAKSVTLELTDKDGNIENYKMTYKTQGVWRIEIEKDLDSYAYRYKVSSNGQNHTIVDPYAVSLSSNAKYAFVVDKSKFYRMKSNVQYKGTQNEAVIYETSVRDFTSKFSNLKNASTYDSFTNTSLKNENSTASGFQYLKKLGITHIQIMPMFEFAGVDEKDRFKKYNWGYNPLYYNAPSGCFTLNPDDPYARINELKRMIDEIHRSGMFVTMDVVYNHVYEAEKYPLEQICPGYMYIYNREGMRTNASGCGNDVNTSKNMVRKFITDSCKYWADEFRVDGFRFDLMGLIDVETMNDIALELKDQYPGIMIYGEGWKMVSSNRADNLAHMYNRNVVSSIGFFNDRFRNTIKEYSAGYMETSNDTIKNCILGSCLDKFLFRYAHQSINYVECHDDMTLFDVLKLMRADIDDEERKKRAILAISITMMSLGIPFFQSGMEFMRSKKGKKNSYNLSDSINGIDWDKMDENEDSIDLFKKLIRIRKKYSFFKLDKPMEIKENTIINFTDKKSILFHIWDTKNELLIVFKTNKDPEKIQMNDHRLLCGNLEYDRQTTVTQGIGVMVLERL